MSRGNSRAHANSWVGYCRLSRTKVTGYKKKRLGHPSEKMGGDTPRAGWRTILFAECLAPLAMAIIFVVAYAYVKSFVDEIDQEQHRLPYGAIVRIAIVAGCPVAGNAAVLLVGFFISLMLGPIFSERWTKFGSIIASIAHFLSVLGMVVVFEFFWFLERWNASHAVLGLVAVIAMQRALFKILVALVLSREMKSDETNRAWWSGRWYGRGFGGHAWSQPAREWVVKIIEMSSYASDLILCHVILFVLAIPCIVPGINQIHSMMLFWLRPGRQIHRPIFSQRQRRARTSIVLRYGLVFALAFIVFVGLIVVPSVLRDQLSFTCDLCQHF